jgi:hypothetical protein
MIVRVTDSAARKPPYPSLRALWSLCWRLSVMLAFLIGAAFFFLIDHWWIALWCLLGFVPAALIIRRVSTVEEDLPPSDRITLL